MTQKFPGQRSRRGANVWDAEQREPSTRTVNMTVPRHRVMERLLSHGLVSDTTSGWDDKVNVGLIFFALGIVVASVGWILWYAIQ